METNALIALTLEACTRLKGKLWPNRIGFSVRGWDYMYNGRVNRWGAARDIVRRSARHPPNAYARVYGEGDTPEAAKLNATPHTED